MASERVSWEIRVLHYDVDADRLGELLVDGWEPFAVDNGRVWMKRYGPKGEHA